VEADGDRSIVDAPASAVDDELLALLTEHKKELLEVLARERHLMEDAVTRGVIVEWATEPDWIALRDPTTSEWHEVRVEECLPGVVQPIGAHRMLVSKPGQHSPSESRSVQ
jgi:hypothetical protein